MSLLSNVLGFSAFGFGARCFQLGLQKRGMFDGAFSRTGLFHNSRTAAPAGHLIAAGAFGLIGWGVYEVEGRQ